MTQEICNSDVKVKCIVKPTPQSLSGIENRYKIMNQKIANFRLKVADTFGVTPAEIQLCGKAALDMTLDTGIRSAEIWRN